MPFDRGGFSFPWKNEAGKLRVFPIPKHADFAGASGFGRAGFGGIGGRRKV